MARQYNSPPTTPSTVGSQINNFYYQKKALIELAKEQHFTQLADVTNMPKNFGKKIKLYHYLPLLDDANINDQGIDAAGVTIDTSKYSVRVPYAALKFTVEADATAASTAINAVEAGVATKTGAAAPWTVTVTKQTLKATTQALANAVVAAVPGSVSIQGSGNLYGSSKDVGTISGKLPALSETGGRVNRVGFTRKELEGTFEKFGFFDEYTEESLNFDTDAELAEHLNREMLRGANEMNEDALQIDLLNAAGVVKFAGNATSNETIDVDDVVEYRDVMHMSIDLDNNRTPKSTKVISGSRMVDTKTINSARVAYIGSELLPTFRAMKDLHGNPAFVSIEKYASAGTILNNEAGAVDQLRLVVVPEMLKWEGAGAVVADNTTHYETNGRLDVFPILIVGSESFTTIGFQTDGKSVKFRIFHKAPGEGAADKSDPFGETGFTSIKWYYGFMALRPERIGLIKTAAKL
jgi:N4-gp56 family major capsid protein